MSKIQGNTLDLSAQSKISRRMVALLKIMLN